MRVRRRTPRRVKRRSRPENKPMEFIRLTVTSLNLLILNHDWPVLHGSCNSAAGREHTSAKVFLKITRALRARFMRGWNNQEKMRNIGERKSAPSVQSKCFMDISFPLTEGGEKI